MKSFICLRSMRPCSSRCSAAFSLRVRSRQFAALPVIAPSAPIAAGANGQYTGVHSDPVARVTYMSIPLMLV